MPLKLDRLWRAAGRTLRSRLLLPWAVLLLLAACTQADNPQAPTPEEPPPAAPSGLEAAAQAGQVVLRWQGQEDGVVGYHVYRSVGEVVPLAEALRLTAEAYQDSSYTDDQLEEAGVYYYRVTAVNEAGQESAASEAVRVLLEPEESGEDPGDEPFTAIAWSPAGKAPLALTEAQGTVLGGELYIFGGYTSFVPDFHTTTTAYAYDPADGQWRRLADMPVPWTHAGAVVDGRDIYLAGGYENPNDNRPREEISDGETTVYRYNADEDRWYSDLPELPEPRGSGGFVRLDRNLHFFGGHTPEREDRQEHWVLSLDLPEAGWQPLEPLPNPRNHLGVVALEGMIYAIGGQHGAREQAVTQNAVHRYDPEMDTWTELASLPQPLSHHTAATLVIDGRIITVGGEQAHEEFVASVFAYDPRQDRWTPLTPLDEPRNAGVGGFINGEIVYVGGAVRPVVFSEGIYRGLLSE